MLSVLFVNCKKAQCSIWDSGLMTFNALKLSKRYQIDYVEVDSDERTFSADYDVFVFNYHPITMRWLDTRCLRRLNGLKLTVVLEVLPNDPFPMCPRNVFDGYLVLDPTMRHEDKRVFAFPRPLEKFEPQVSYADTSIPVIGTFGFATHGKGFERVIEAVNTEFDRAVVRINIPHGTYVARSAEYAQELADACFARARKGVEVRVTHDYMTKQQLVDWCASNTLNCFLYDRNMPGLAATTDQAIVAMRPLSVSRNDTFRHITQYVRPYPEWSLRDSIAKSLPGVAQMKADWAPARFAERFEQVLSECRATESVRTGAKRFSLGKRGLDRRMADAGVDRWNKLLKGCVDFKRNTVLFMRLAKLQYERMIVRNYVSYSQAGEDLIVRSLFRSFGVEKISYLDVGANHPGYISNTFFFYKMGCTGVCIEPNLRLYKKHRQLRPSDVCLNMGVGIDGRNEAEFYQFEGHADGLSTFSKEDADHWANIGMDGIGRMRPAKVIKMPLVDVNTIIIRYGVPDFMSLDVEGHDLEILRMLDFQKFPLKCICVETLRHGKDHLASRDMELLLFMKQQGYFVYADTGINTIFVNLNWLTTGQRGFEKMDARAE